MSGLRSTGVSRNIQNTYNVSNSYLFFWGGGLLLPNECKGDGRSPHNMP